MLGSLKQVLGYSILSIDGEIGRIMDFYFDDVSWNIRYIVVDTARWLTGRHVLVSPTSAGEADDELRQLPVRLTRQQIKDSPDVATHLPVARQHELDLARYYGWPAYWEGPVYTGIEPFAIGVGAKDADYAGLTEGTQGEPHARDLHLRSLQSMLGMHIVANDGELGHVEDFISVRDGWAIRYMLVDTCNILPCNKAMVAPQWIKEVDWDNHRVHVDLDRETIKNAPDFAPKPPPAGVARG
jgi:hypothetical protein